MKAHSLTSLWLLLAGLLAVYALPAQHLRYTLAAPNAAHHEAHISVVASGLPAGPVTLRMSRSSPGRYATHEFGKNVYDLRATDEQGKPLATQKTAGDVYVVSGHKGTVQWQYTLFGHHGDGTYADIDISHWLLNMPATCMYVQGQEQAPVEVNFVLPAANWTVATQLYPTKNPRVFTAPNLQYLMDAPVLAGPLRYRQWPVPGGASGKGQTIRIAFDTEASDAALDAFAQKVERITHEAAAVFGDWPDFETGQYTFLASLNPYVRSDGMEHRNSTMIPTTLAAADIEKALGTFAHEFFHAWNVERIRPRSLEPFAFDRSNMSESLWLAEGFTSYYGALIEKRAGLITENDWLNQVAYFVQTKLQAPGGMDYSVVQNSQDAVFVDAGVSIDKNNFYNHHSSYYITGAATAMALELALQQRGLTLDHYMRQLWLQHGKPEKPYTLADLEQVLATTTGDAAFARSFFEKYILQPGPYPYAENLAALGLKMEPRKAMEPWVGNTNMEMRQEALTLTGGTVKYTPLYQAGLDMGDALLKADGKPIRNGQAWKDILAAHQPGDSLRLRYRHRGQIAETTLHIAARPDILVVPQSQASAAAVKRRQAWTNAKSR